MSKEKAATSVVEAVLAADAGSLDEIDSAIAEREREIADKQKEIDGLRRIRRAIDVRLNGAKPRKPREAKQKKSKDHGNAGEAESESPVESGGMKLSERIYDLISREGSMPAMVIAQRLGVRAAVVGMTTATCDWFERRDGEVHIARAGK